MSFKLNVTLRGLHMLVPSRPVDFRGAGPAALRLDSLLVITPAVRKQTIRVRDVDPPQKFDVDAHEAFVRAEEQRSEPLNGDWLTLGGPAHDGVELRPAARRIVQLRVAARQPVTPDPALLVAPPAAPPPGRLASSFRLSSGLVFGADPSELAFGFGDAYRGRFFRDVRVEIEVPADEAQLRMSPFDGGRERLMTLRPIRPRRSVDLMVSNLCKKDVAIAPEPDEDFAVYYDLLDGYTGRRFVPVPILPSPDEVAALAVRPGGCFPTIA